MDDIKGQVRIDKEGDAWQYFADQRTWELAGEKRQVTTAELEQYFGPTTLVYTPGHCVMPRITDEEIRTALLGTIGFSYAEWGAFIDVGGDRPHLISCGLVEADMRERAAEWLAKDPDCKAHVKRRQIYGTEWEKV